MKLRILFLLIMSCISSVYGQKNKFDLDYIDLELLTGNYFMLEMDWNFVTHKNLILKAGIAFASSRSKNLPEDYNPKIYILPYPHVEIPKDRAFVLHLQTGKLLSLEKQGRIRANLTAGVGVSQVSFHENFRPTGGGLFSSSHTSEKATKVLLSLVINPEVEILYRENKGITLSCFLSLAPNDSIIGIGFGKMIGGKIKK